MINQAYTPSTNGLQSYIDAAPSYELAPIGIASMQDQAQKLAEFGRNGDLYVVHAAEGETVIPMEVLEANPQIKALLFNQMTEMGLDPQRYVVGDQLNSLNPVTGMPEFFFKSIFKGIKKAVKSVVKVAKKIAPVALPIIGATIGLPFLGPAFAAGSMASMALTSGIGTLIGGGSLKDAFKSALISGASAGIFGALKGATPSSWGFGGTGTVAGAKEGFMQSLKGGYYTPPSSALPSSQIVRPETVFAEPTIATPELGIRPSSVDVNRMINPAIDYPSELNLAGGKFAGGKFGPGLPVDGAPSQISMGSGWEIPGAGTPSIRGSAAKYFSRITDQPVVNADEYAKLLEQGNLLDAAGNIIKKPGLLGTGQGPLGLPGTGNKLVDTALYGGGAYLGAKALGAFDVAEEEEIRPEDAPLGVASQAIDPALVQAAEIDVGQIPVADEEVVVADYSNILPSTLLSAAHGGSVNYPRRDLLVEDPGTEKSDDIPAMLSDGEFVINSRAVRGADPSGRGNRYAGAQNLYNLMRNFEMRA